MSFAMIGLGKMGGNMVRRLARKNLEAVVFDRDPAVVASLSKETGAKACASLADLVAAMTAPRLVWLMLPAGAATQSTIDALLPLLGKGDVLIDGANAWYRDTLARNLVVAQRGMHLVDVGVSGGVWGLENGYGLMFGGDKAAIAPLQPYLEALAPSADRGWVHCGPTGAGHFVKMVHNGIEYGLMQAYAEGFALMAAKTDFDLDVAKIAESWRHGTVIRSWLLDLTAEFLATDKLLADTAPLVADSGEGRWTSIESIELGVPTPVMTMALMERFGTQGKGDYGHKLLARMRHAFGGHAVKSAGKS
ncbi:MAG: decarboxylating 6-phosphogluconate dehydrogenase [Pseudomonadales bacterium]|nr:decarboxylating 6-phosphogluconate dehydrogenase [Pseudomonadales bacterium]